MALGGKPFTVSKVKQMQKFFGFILGNSAPISGAGIPLSWKPNSKKPFMPHCKRLARWKCTFSSQNLPHNQQLKENIKGK